MNINQRIADLADRSKSYESLMHAMTADMRVFRHLIVTEIVANTEFSDNLLWEMRDALMDANQASQVLACTYKIIERKAQERIGEILEREIMADMAEYLQDRSISQVQSGERHMNTKLKPVLILVTDRYGDVIYPPPVKMMRDHLSLSQRQMAKQATRDKMPRDVSESVQCPVADTQKAGLLRRMIDAGLRLARSRL